MEAKVTSSILESPENCQRLLDSLDKAEPSFGPQKEVISTEAKKEGIQLHSLVPVFRLLPAFQNDDGHYVLIGDISDDDVKRVVEYSAAVYMRFLRRTAPTPLFISLDSIRLFSPSSRLHYLTLLLSSSLTRLEISDIPSTAVHLVKSFLSALPYEAPCIKRLELRGPQQLSEAALYPIAQLKQLDTLELDDILNVSGTSFLKRLGELPLLEVFNISVPASCPTLSPPSDHPPDSAGFPKLKSLCVTGSIRLIYDLVSLVLSQMLSTLKLHVVIYPSDVPSEEAHFEELQIRRKQVEQLKQRQREREEVGRLAAATQQKAQEKDEEILSSQQGIAAAKEKISSAKIRLQKTELHLQQLQRARKTKMIKKRLKKLEASGASPEMLENARTDLESTVTLEGNSKAITAAKKQIEGLKMEVAAHDINLSALERSHSQLVSSVIPVVPDTIVIDEPQDIVPELTEAVAWDMRWQQMLGRTLDTVISRWRHTLDSLKLSTDENLSSTPTPVIKLLALISSISKGWPNIHFLHLPLNCASGVTFDALHAIARSCPRLDSLKIKLDVSIPPQLSDTSGATFALNHGLTTLTLDSAASVDERKDRMRIARFLNSLFPDLKILSSDPAVDTWTEVSELMKLFQLVREDDKCRSFAGDVTSVRK